MFMLIIFQVECLPYTHKHARFFRRCHFHLSFQLMWCWKLIFCKYQPIRTIYAICASFHICVVERQGYVCVCVCNSLSSVKSVENIMGSHTHSSKRPYANKHTHYSLFISFSVRSLTFSLPPSLASRFNSTQAIAIHCAVNFYNSLVF